LGELSVAVEKAIVVYCDNISSVYMASNPVHHRRTKHIELDIHFVREKVAIGDVRVLHVPTGQQFADIMTKGLPSSVFKEFCSSLGISRPDAPTAGGCWRHGHRGHRPPEESLHDPISWDRSDRLG